MASLRTRQHSNLECFLDRVTPTVPSQVLPKEFEKETIEYFTLGDLWECYDEWSAYGAGAPIVLPNNDSVVQYYVPYLSALQIYTSKSYANLRKAKDESEASEFESDSWSDDSESDKLSRSLSNNSSRGWDAGSDDSSFEPEGLWSTRERLGYLYCQYFERCSPYGRIPLMDTVNELSIAYPELTTLRSIDLSPASWLAVAWYPIYHIPTGRNVKDLVACFLTYHTLSSSFQDNADDETTEGYGNTAHTICSYHGGLKAKCVAECSGMLLPPFGLATYKMYGSLWINSEAGDQERLVSLFNAADSWLKQLRGVIWVLEPDKVPKVSLDGGPPKKVSKEQKSNKELVEVYPLKKIGKVEGNSLILVDFDGSESIIHLPGCTVEAVSASLLPSRKWSKRYPIRVENKRSLIYNGSNTCYIYLETSWEKESWCKALRLASSVDDQRRCWYNKLNEEFHCYVSSLTAEYPFFMKPRARRIGGAAGRGNSVIDGSSSKVRLFLKKLAKKTSKGGSEFRTDPLERKTSCKKLASKSAKVALDRVSESIPEEIMPSAISHVGSHSQVTVISDSESDDKSGSNEGVLCWNLLLSRLFFDAKRSSEISISIKSRIQRALSNMRTPSYIGAISCTAFDIGNLPPYFHNMRVLPMDINEVWVMEVDFEYSGGAVLDVETRVEVREPELQEGLEQTSLDPTSSGDATPDLLKGLEYYEEQLKLSTVAAHRLDKSTDIIVKPDDMSNLKSTSWKSIYTSRWKSILNSVADQVSQVPLSLAIRITSLRGTLRLHIKPPPSDQLWFGFLTMPDIEWVIDSSVGDHKITSTQIALIISNRFKAAIRETMVLPNCETVCIPWMLAEKADWIPRKFAPFLWIHQEGGESTREDTALNSQKGGEGAVNIASSTSTLGSNHDPHGNHVQDDGEKLKLARSTSSQSGQPASASSISNNDDAIAQSSIGVEELQVPLLASDKRPENMEHARVEDRMGSIVIHGNENNTQILSDSDDAKPKRVGRRARMMDLGKKMGEKLEEKRRHIEEKSRHIVEKMRENAKTSS
ncbi:hypothetical protein H6P81_017881 [Aristolochia fimbriata]|uniref:SMP-LTD domain-containing protein n=1 Tax=Aristolochia fimbriata TaxID=158543 RepID=A0AAV7DZW2_ARIFI|nr:hypothetical protein H6P81_017881 [Aristolochia fimbriata]